nr:unnamed protein product [Callosobruchus chinensis]
MTLRAATDAFWISRTVSVLCDASVIPLRLKIGMQTLNYAVKVKSLHEHLNAALFNSSSGNYTQPQSGAWNFKNKTASNIRNVVTAMEDEFTRDESIVKIHDQIVSLKEENKHVSCMWIPSHIGIRDNERADQAAREAANSEDKDDSIPPYRDIVSHIKVVPAAT